MVGDSHYGRKLTLWYETQIVLCKQHQVGEVVTITITVLLSGYIYGIHLTKLSQAQCYCIQQENKYIFTVVKPVCYPEGCLQALQCDDQFLFVCLPFMVARKVSSPAYPHTVEKPALEKWTLSALCPIKGIMTELTPYLLWATIDLIHVSMSHSPARYLCMFLAQKP